MLAGWDFEGMVEHVCLVVRFELREGHQEDFDRLTAETVSRIESEEPGTLAYVTHGLAEDPSIRMFYELYEDEAAFQTHESTEHTRRFLREREYHLRGAPEVWFVTPGNGFMREDMNLGAV